jgi:plastocyanin
VASVRIRSIAAVASAAIIIVVLVTAASAHPIGPRTPTRATKIVKGIGTGHWSPATVTISAGDSIKWKAVNNRHTVTAYGGHWRFNQQLSVGHPVSFRFTRAGTYRFRCLFHSTLVSGQCQGMCGKVVVSS